MKTVEELKQEQYDVKAKLHEMVEFINSEEYYKLPVEKRSLINQQRVGMELYLGSLTKRIYESDTTTDTSNLIWLSMLYGMFNTSSGGWGVSSSTDSLKTKLEEDDFKVETDE